MTQFTFAAKTAVSLTPNNTGGAATSWTVTPALPGGLSFSTSTGAITGTPSSFGPTTVTVKATNAGGSSQVALTLRADSVVLNLGSTCLVSIADTLTQGVLAISSSNVLTMDCAGGHWALWDRSTGALVAQGNPCTGGIDCPAANPSGLPTYAQLAGSIGVLTDNYGFQVISTSDGSVLSAVTSVLQWYHAASDGSYICGAAPASSGGNLTIWAPNGSVLANVSGDYSAAQAYCAPGHVQVALGPKGSNVIETIAVPTGMSSVSPAFAGTFNSWFGDGNAFLSNVGPTVWVYSPAAVQLDHQPSLSTAGRLGGWGPWFWTADGTTLNIYKVGSSATPTASFPAGSISASGSTIAILGGTLGIVDLSGAIPTVATYALPARFGSDVVYAAVSASQWVVGDSDGVVLDGPSLATTPRYFGYGRVLGLAGSATRFAVGTSIGTILVFNTNDLSLETTLALWGNQLQISTAGTVLAVLSDASPPGSSATVETLSLPSATVINTWTYPYGTLPIPKGITLSSSGSLLGQVLLVNAIGETYMRQVTSSSGGPVLWSDTAGSAPINLSLDDTLIAVSNGTNSNIYLNDALSTAVTGVAVGWLQGDNLAVDVGNPGAGPLAAVIYNSAGIKQSGPALPYLQPHIQVLSSTSIYDEDRNAIYSLTTGLQTWAPPTNSGRGTAAGPLIVFLNGNNQLVAEPY
jgi:hypothetical protein